jgi:hypothetical protein
MKGIFIIALVIAITFFIIKFIEMRFIEKESKPLKLLIRDSLLVYFSVIVANFVIDQVNPLMSGGNKHGVITPVFTDNPGF